jgi:hypothetical protein
MDVSRVFDNVVGGNHAMILKLKIDVVKLLM